MKQASHHCLGFCSPQLYHTTTGGRWQGEFILVELQLGQDPPETQSTLVTLLLGAVWNTRGSLGPEEREGGTLFSRQQL
jgi:hypothetical protein